LLIYLNLGYGLAAFMVGAQPVQAGLDISVEDQVLQQEIVVGGRPFAEQGGRLSGEASGGTVLGRLQRQGRQGLLLLLKVCSLN